MLNVICRKIIRNGMTTVLLFFGFTLSFVMFLYFDTANRMKASEKRDAEIYKYNSRISYLACSDDFDINALEKNDFPDCDIVIADLNLFVGDMEFPRLANVVYTDGALMYPVVKGHYPTQDELKSGEHLVVLGKGLKRHTYSRGGSDYVKINKEEYRVTGYVSAENSTILDHSVFVYYTNIGNNVLDDILLWKRMMGINICFLSNSVDRDKIAEGLDKYEKAYFPMLQRISYDDTITVTTDVAESDNIELAVIVYICSIVLIVLSVNYMFTVNKREYAIRRACGYSVYALILRFAAGVLCYVFFAVVASETVLLLFDIAENRLVFDMFDTFVGHARILIKYVLSITPLVVIVPAYTICKIEPITAIRRN